MAAALAVFEVVILLPCLAAGSLLLSTSVSCVLSASFELGVCFYLLVCLRLFLTHFLICLKARGSPEPC